LSCGGVGGADAPAFVPAQQPGIAPPLKAAALILSSCLHFLVLVQEFVCPMQLWPAQALRFLDIRPDESFSFPTPEEPNKQSYDFKFDASEGN
jgi:hypothetical protein